MGDLQSMASTFHAQAENYASLKAVVVPPIAPSGDAALDDAIGSMLEAIAGLHAKLAGRIEDHGGKLQYTHDSIGRGDAGIHDAFDDLMPDGI